MRSTDAFPAKYMKSADVKTKPLVATISHMQMELVGQGQEQREKPVLFLENQKPIVLNRDGAQSRIVLSAADRIEANESSQQFCAASKDQNSYIDCLTGANGALERKGLWGAPPNRTGPPEPESRSPAGLEDRRASENDRLAGLIASENNSTANNFQARKPAPGGADTTGGRTFISLGEAAQLAVERLCPVVVDKPTTAKRKSLCDAIQ
jgi:hypothetical protein